MHKFIWLEVILLVKFIKHNQNYYIKLDVSTSIRGLREKKLVPVLNFSGYSMNLAFGGLLLVLILQTGKTVVLFVVATVASPVHATTTETEAFEYPHIKSQSNAVVLPVAESQAF